jgi:hypothetical protein
MKKCVVCSSYHDLLRKTGGVLTVKFDYVLKGALVDIIPVLIMKNIQNVIDTSS